MELAIQSYDIIHIKGLSPFLDIMPYSNIFAINQKNLKSTLFNFCQTVDKKSFLDISGKNNYNLHLVLTVFRNRKSKI